MNQKDVICCAPPRSGKTGAYAIPLLNSIINLRRFGPDHTIEPYVLVIGPSKNVVMEIHSEFIRLAKNTGIKCEYVVNGNADQLNRCIGCDVFVVSIWQLKDLMSKKEVSMKKCKFFIIDEAIDVFIRGS